MSISASDNAWLTCRFDGVGMDTLNRSAAMLQRLDNKYIVDAAILERALPMLSDAFDMLEMAGLRAFAYETCYFDGPAWQSYHDHHQGRRKRAKVRMRRYLDSEQCFVEIKLKDKRGITVKRRMPCDPAAFGILDEAAHAHVRNAYREMYLDEFPHSLSRTLDTHYRRMSLVAKSGGERLTIDSGLRFQTEDRSREVAQRLFILETKSANGNGTADRILRKLHQHPVGHCSKYCAGMALLQTGLKHNNFKPVLRKLGAVS